MTQTQRRALGPEAIGLELAATELEYTERDVMLYALGIGATELDFVYERSLKAIPTFAVIPAFPAMMGLSAAVEINLVMVLHGEQGFRIHKTIPTKGKLTTKGKVSGVYDKGKGALASIESETRDESGDLIFTNTSGVFVRGAGGFGGERGPEAGNNPPDRSPDKIVEMQTLPIQAMIYRLSGDRNPLHIDPDFAKMAGYDRPILHGLCTFGHVGRAVLSEYAGNDPSRLTALSVRFSGVVYPGDTIITEMWDEGSGKIILQAKTQEGRVVISNAAAEVK
ncbi:MAG TPA: MaoC/PaaZ C-terminal domain-containing protein [Dehalococcoidia bacterium]|jgi:acyl dehydratase|nr:MaoC/PaaZ C-terminal domain-containing protein [Dehalococcoidia bacterium]